MTTRRNPIPPGDHPASETELHPCVHLDCLGRMEIVEVEGGRYAAQCSGCGYRGGSGAKPSRAAQHHAKLWRLLHPDLAYATMPDSRRHLLIGYALDDARVPAGDLLWRVEVLLGLRREEPAGVALGALPPQPAIIAPDPAPGRVCASCGASMIEGKGVACMSCGADPDS